MKVSVLGPKWQAIRPRELYPRNAEEKRREGLARCSATCSAQVLQEKADRQQNG
jgi:hypothetical protein